VDCRNHPGVPAITRCTGCAEPFCNNCLVDLKGQKYCGSCKVMALQGRSLAALVANKLCPEAKEALALSIVGLGLLLFCIVGVGLEVFAIVKANAAKKSIDADPTLAGGGMANAAIIISVLGILLWVASKILVASAGGRM
jgi:hypothetical protein